ncbi:mCG126763, partial [Mus musculus]
QGFHPSNLASFSDNTVNEPNVFTTVETGLEEKSLPFFLFFSFLFFFSILNKELLGSILFEKSQNCGTDGF